MKNSSTTKGADGQGRMPCRRLDRRRFLKCAAACLAGTSIARAAPGQPPAAASNPDDQAVEQLIAANCPSRLKELPANFNEMVGATHVAGKYHLTQKPFLLEGAEKLLELGTRLGKFWFMPKNTAGSYPFNSQWGRYENFVALAQADYFRQLFALPFATVILEAHTPVEEGWQRADLPASFYAGVTREFYDLTTHLYRTYRERPLTIVLQHWEGDWMLRGRGGELWNPPPKDWPDRCARMAKWLAARQQGVTTARAEFGARARCRVAHATEVNRVADIWQGIPTVTQHVLPKVELDLVAYSCYDGLKSPLQLWKCIEEIKKHARTGPLFGKQAVFIGEVGVPEREQPQRLAERWDQWLGVMLAAKVHYVVHWELYCNEFSRQSPKPPRTPVTDPAHLRGFWLVKPDGSLSESGQYFQQLWQRARKAGQASRLSRS